MDTKRVATVIALLIGLVACNKYIEKSKYEESERQLQQARSELEDTKNQLQQTQQKLAQASAQKYSTYQNGFRRWRFNSATGETCIMLTTAADWKRKETQLQSCDCYDTRTEFEEARENAKPGEIKQVMDTWGPWIKQACGQ